MKTIEFNAPLVSLEDLAKTIENRLIALDRERKAKTANYDTFITEVCTTEADKAEYTAKKHDYEMKVEGEIYALRQFAKELELNVEDAFYDSNRPYHVSIPFHYHATMKF